MKKITTIILLLFSIVSFGQTTKKDIKEVNDKLELLKNEIKEIDNINTYQQRKLIELEEVKTIKSQYKNRIESINTTLQEAKERENSFLTYIQWFFTILGTVILFFTGSSYYEMKESRKKIKEEKEQQFSEQINLNNKLFSDKISELITKNDTHIKSIVDEKTWEFRLMAKSNIIVINPNSIDDAKNLQPILKWFQKKEGSIKHIPETDFNMSSEIENKVKENVDNTKFNIVLLENSDGKWNIDHRNTLSTDHIYNATHIAANLPDKTMLLYFGPREAGDFPNRSENYYNYFNSRYTTLIEKKDLSEKEKQELNTIISQNKENVNKIIDHISFANTPSKLYPNLIDALKYMDIINPNINA
ncbi:hypothetical protein Lupro_02545 [Lutibacter profundi]|uniref:Uncharacterized protein n=1 Tax=Lutibacter profundi TaxID=1622118 RepID=A0A0X8G519_9FLAO|nr:hypothetical protein [Lutibacter profundi]AMC10198.1 hypothetical protein Lupro_02545 [Lutibacter profundi]